MERDDAASARVRTHHAGSAPRAHLFGDLALGCLLVPQLRLGHAAVDRQRLACHRRLLGVEALHPCTPARADPGEHHPLPTRRQRCQRAAGVHCVYAGGGRRGRRAWVRAARRGERSAAGGARTGGAGTCCG